MSAAKHLEGIALPARNVGRDHLLTIHPGRGTSYENVAGQGMGARGSVRKPCPVTIPARVRLTAQPEGAQWVSWRPFLGSASRGWRMMLSVRSDSSMGACPSSERSHTSSRRTRSASRSWPSAAATAARSSLGISSWGAASAASSAAARARPRSPFLMAEVVAMWATSTTAQSMCWSSRRSGPAVTSLSEVLKMCQFRLPGDGCGGGAVSSKTTRFEGLLEAVPDALVGVDHAGVIRFVNRQTELLFGYERDDLIGAPLETLVPESLRPVHKVRREGYVVAPFTRAMGTDLELRGGRRDGTQFPVDIALSHTHTEDGPLVIAAVRDMTGRKKAEEGRRHSDELAAIVEHSDDAIIGKTLDGIVTSWNPAAERMYGYSAQEITGKSIDQLSPPDQAGQMHTILARIRAGQPVERLEATRVRKDGSAITVSLTVSPIHDQRGAIIGASTIARDMTGARQAFEAARSMIESSLDSLVAINPEGKITDANEATVKVTGIPRVELIGTAFSECFTEPEKADRIYQLVFDQGMAVDYPLTMRHRDGTLTEVLYNASVYRDAGGKVLGVFAAARDVTKQRQAGAQYVRSLLEAALDPLVTISPAGKITDANEATVKATGIPRQELIGTAFSECFIEPEKANAIYQLVFEQGMAVDYPLTMRHPDGTLTEVLYNASVYRDVAGKVLGVFAAARDVTDQNQARIEIALQQATALTRLAELEQFHRLTVGRELKMIELKKENEYLRRSGHGDGGNLGDEG